MLRLLLFIFWTVAILPSRIFADPTAVEICDNGLDDDLDGLTDCEDPDCYFSSATCTCTQTTVIWAVTNNNTLVWFNPSNGQEMTIGSFSTSLSDVAWSSNGKLYGITTAGALYEINPGNGTLTFVSSNISAPGQVTSLCTDEAGNFYYSTRSGSSPRYIYKYDPVSGIQTTIANIGTYECAGDIAFVDGTLYLTTIGYDLLVVDITTGNYTVKNLPTLSFEYYGLVSDANGVLYASAGKDLYIINTSTGGTTSLYTSTASISQFYGLSILSDNCQSQTCNPGVEISVPLPPYCEGSTVVLTATIPAGYDPYSGPFNWEGPGGTGTGNNISVSAAGQYILSIGLGNCTASDTFVLTLESLPLVDLGADKSFNQGQSVVIQPTVIIPGVSYTWADGPSGPTRNINIPGTYIIIATNACGVDKDTIIVTENPLPCNLTVIISAGPVPYCTGVPVPLSASMAPGSDPYSGIFSWTTPTGNITGSAINAAIPGNYNVSVDDGNCNDTDAIQISFLSPPTVSLGEDQLICPGETISLNPTGGTVQGTTYTWEDNSSILPRLVTQEGVYILTATNACGEAKDTILITSEADCLCQVIAPTAFSPNGDGQNDTFILLNGCPDPIILETLEVYNRWNEKLYSSIDAGKGWDGTYQGVPVPVDVYIYFASGSAGNRPFTLKGVLTLLR